MKMARGLRSGLLGLFGSVKRRRFTHNPDIDKDVEVSAISISAPA